MILNIIYNVAVVVVVLKEQLGQLEALEVLEVLGLLVVPEELGSQDLQAVPVPVGLQEQQVCCSNIITNYSDIMPIINNTES